MVGGGPFGLQPGQWTDDTSLALCLAESLIESGGFDPRDQNQRYLRWYREGYLSSTGHYFDIGNATQEALIKFERSGDPYSGSTDPYSAGNGSIMRLAPVPMFFVNDLDDVAHYSAQSSRTTHGTAEAVDACRLFGVMIALALRGESKETVLFSAVRHLDDAALAPKVAAIAKGEYRKKSRKEIRGNGYVINSLEAALWVFWKTGNYRQAVLDAVNLGEDTDTTAAVVGQLAGAFYGAEAIPAGWREKVALRETIEDYAFKLYEERPDTNS
jgi:ADP-ribosyl-[dinitrogen reductase] hydrolase